MKNVCNLQFLATSSKIYHQRILGRLSVSFLSLHFMLSMTGGVHNSRQHLLGWRVTNDRCHPNRLKCFHSGKRSVLYDIYPHMCTLGQIRISKYWLISVGSFTANRPRVGELFGRAIMSFIFSPIPGSHMSVWVNHLQICSRVYKFTFWIVCVPFYSRGQAWLSRRFLECFFVNCVYCSIFIRGTNKSRL